MCRQYFMLDFFFPSQLGLPFVSIDLPPVSTQFCKGQTSIIMLPSKVVLSHWLLSSQCFYLLYDKQCEMRCKYNHAELLPVPVNPRIVMACHDVISHHGAHHNTQPMPCATQQSATRLILHGSLHVFLSQTQPSLSSPRIAYLHTV